MARSSRHGEEGGDWTGLERPVLAGEDGTDADCEREERLGED